jgi:hypothetical protein
MTGKPFIARGLTGGARKLAITSTVLTGVVLWLCLGSASALAAAPKFGMENSATQLCASSGSGAPGTVVRQQSCSQYNNHSGNYQEYWATQDSGTSVKLEAFHQYNGQEMCLTVRNGVLEPGTPMVMEPCGGGIALGQEFDELGTAAGGALIRPLAESGRRVDNPLKLSVYCVASRGAAVVLARCNNRLSTQSWLGLADEGSPSSPSPGGGDPTRG